MKRSISVGNHSYPVDYPDKCPMCHHHGEISVIKTLVEPENRGVQIVFQCAYSDCRSYFIGYYGPRGSADLLALKTQKPELTVLPE